MNPRHLRLLAVLVLGFQAGACVSWEPVTVSPREFIEGERPSRGRVTPADGPTIVVLEPTVQNDSIATSQSGCSSRERASGTRVCIPTSRGVVALRDVLGIDRPTGSAGETLLFIAAVPVALTVAALVVLAASGGPWQ